MSFIQPIPITDNISLKVEAPLNALPDSYIALLNSMHSLLNVPEVALISGLLAAVYTAACGRFKIEVRKNYFEPFTEYFIVVMPSGSKKSAVVQTFKIPLEKYIEKLQAEFDKKAPNKKRIIQLYKKVEKNLVNTCANELVGEDIAEIEFRLKDIQKTLELGCPKI